MQNKKGMGRAPCAPKSQGKKPKYAAGATAAPERPYVLREPTTGLYAVFGDPGHKRAARLDYQANATRFATSAEALVAAGAAGITSQPHELVRVDA
jgi:hypothetical protein